MTDYTKEAEELYPYKKYENLRKGIIYSTIIDSYREAHIAARQRSAAEIDRLRGEVERLCKLVETLFWEAKSDSGYNIANDLWQQFKTENNIQ